LNTSELTKFPLKYVPSKWRKRGDVEENVLRFLRGIFKSKTGEVIEGDCSKPINKVLYRLFIQESQAAVLSLNTQHADAITAQYVLTMTANNNPTIINQGFKNL
jgi:hypothetical protein